MFLFNDTNLLISVAHDQCIKILTTPRLSGHFSMFSMVFFVLKSDLKAPESGQNFNITNVGYLTTLFSMKKRNGPWEQEKRVTSHPVSLSHLSLRANYRKRDVLVRGRATPMRAMCLNVNCALNPFYLVSCGTKPSCQVAGKALGAYHLHKPSVWKSCA